MFSGALQSEGQHASLNEMAQSMTPSNSHSLLLGYVFWLVGFTGSHRFYYGKPISGIIWFCTLGLLGIGWLIDLVLIPSMDRQADWRFEEGPYNYNVGWALLVFLGIFGVHRFYLGKWISGVVYLLTGGLFFIGYVYDLCTWNDQVREKNLLGT